MKRLIAVCIVLMIPAVAGAQSAQSVTNASLNGSYGATLSLTLNDPGKLSSTNTPTSVSGFFSALAKDLKGGKCDLRNTFLPAKAVASQIAAVKSVAGDQLRGAGTLNLDGAGNLTGIAYFNTTVPGFEFAPAPFGGANVGTAAVLRGGTAGTGECATLCTKSNQCATPVSFTFANALVTGVTGGGYNVDPADGSVLVVFHAFPKAPMGVCGSPTPPTSETWASCCQDNNLQIVVVAAGGVSTVPCLQSGTCVGAELAPMNSAFTGDMSLK
jgi:hypothetical protein